MWETLQTERLGILSTNLGIQLQIQCGLGWPSIPGGQCELQPTNPEEEVLSNPEQKASCHSWPRKEGSALLTALVSFLVNHMYFIVGHEFR